MGDVYSINVDGHVKKRVASVRESTTTTARAKNQRSDKTSVGKSVRATDVIRVVKRTGTVPMPKRRRQLLDTYHSGHFAAHDNAGVMYQKMQPFYGKDWHTLRGDVINFVDNCAFCQQRALTYDKLPP